MAVRTPLTGELCRWDDDRGFGYIAPTGRGREIFVHISAFARDGSRPTVGESLCYEPGRSKDGKQQAVRVQRLALAAASGDARGGTVADLHGRGSEARGRSRTPGDARGRHSAPSRRRPRLAPAVTLALVTAAAG